MDLVRSYHTSCRVSRLSYALGRISVPVFQDLDQKLSSHIQARAAMQCYDLPFTFIGSPPNSADCLIGPPFTTKNIAAVAQETQGVGLQAFFDMIQRVGEERGVMDAAAEEQDDWLPLSCVREFLTALCGTMVRTMADIVEPADGDLDP